MFSYLLIFISFIFSLVISIFCNLWWFFGGYIFCFISMSIGAWCFAKEEQKNN